MIMLYSVFIIANKCTIKINQYFLCGFLSKTRTKKLIYLLNTNKWDFP